VSCREGTHYRTRPCDSPSPSNGGAYCLGDPFQFPRPKSLSVSTYDYTYFKSSSSRITFEARGNNDGTILFSSCDGCDGFEIVIGGWANKYSVIRQFKQEDVIDERTETPDIMSTTEMREFWIDVKAEGEGLRIEVGRGEDAEGFMSRSWDQNPAESWPPTHVAFAAWDSQVDYEFCLPGITCRCPGGWSQFGENCYKYFNNSVEWGEAREQCRSEKADLASIHFEEEHDFLLEIIGNARNVWVGGRRSCSGCEDFEWSDGTPMDFTAWHRVQPDNYNGAEECMEDVVEDDGFLKWNDLNCSYKREFLCKMAK